MPLGLQKGDQLLAGHVQLFSKGENSNPRDLLLISLIRSEVPYQEGAVAHHEKDEGYRYDYHPLKIRAGTPRVPEREGHGDRQHDHQQDSGDNPEKHRAPHDNGEYHGHPLPELLRLLRKLLLKFRLPVSLDVAKPIHEIAETGENPHHTKQNKRGDKRSLETCGTGYKQDNADD